MFLKRVYGGQMGHYNLLGPLVTKSRCEQTRIDTKATMKEGRIGMRDGSLGLIKPSRYSCNPKICATLGARVKTRQETSMRPFVHSTGQLIWTDVGLSTTRQEGAATQICVT